MSILVPKTDGGPVLAVLADRYMYAWYLGTWYFETVSRTHTPVVGHHTHDRASHPPSYHRAIPLLARTVCNGGERETCNLRPGVYAPTWTKTGLIKINLPALLGLGCCSPSLFPHSTPSEFNTSKCCPRGLVLETTY